LRLLRCYFTFDSLKYKETNEGSPVKIHRTELPQISVGGFEIVVTEYYKEEHETWDEFLSTIREMLQGSEWSLCHGGARMIERNKVSVTEQTKKKVRK